MKTPISYYGGKQQMLPVIKPLIPNHRIYTESFCGGAAVFWAKEPAPVEIINDMNGNVANFYKVLRSDLEGLKKHLSATLHSRETYKYALTIYHLPYLFTEMQRAWAFWICTNSGFSHQIGSWAFDSSGKTVKMLGNKLTMLTTAYAERLKNVTVEQNDACRIIERFDAPDAFHYVDPPYLNCDQGHYAGYAEDDFKRLLNALSGVKGKFLMSSYPHPLLTEYAAKNGWNTKEIVMHLSASSKSGKRKTEILTANYEIG